MRTFVPRRSVAKRVRAWFATYEWWLVGGAIVAAAVGGYYGIARACAATASPQDLLLICQPTLEVQAGNTLTRLDIAYLAAQLFVWQSGSAFLGGNLHWTLEIARFLAPLVVAYAAVRALLGLFVEQFQLLRALIRRNHVIIAGPGADALHLARGFHAAGWRVVTIASDDAPARAARAYGAVLRRSASDEEALTTAGLLRARHLIAIGPQDVLNVEVSATAAAMPGIRRQLTCHALIADPTLWEGLRTREVTASRDAGARLQFFNPYDLAARSALTAISAPARGANERRDTHLLLVGWSAVTERIIVHFGRWWQLGPAHEHRRALISVADRDASRQGRAVAARYPALPRTCELAPYDVDATAGDLRPQLAAFIHDGRRVTAACVTAPADASAIALTRSLLEESDGLTFPVIVCARDGAGAEVLLGDLSMAEDFVRLSVCETPDGALTPELVLDASNEMLARAIHDEYRCEQERAAQSVRTNLSMQPWEMLDDALRESNRQQADHIDKLDVLGCRVVHQLDCDAPLAEFSAEEIERLARWEHERWVREREASGWRHDAGAKSAANQTSPYLTEWNSCPSRFATSIVISFAPSPPCWPASASASCAAASWPRQRKAPVWKPCDELYAPSD